jgi:hypothetical protein
VRMCISIVSPKAVLWANGRSPYIHLCFWALFSRGLQRIEIVIIVVCICFPPIFNTAVLSWFIPISFNDTSPSTSSLPSA